MSSVIFQPLLHDPLGWKPSNSTYTDHYKWRKYRTTSKDRKISNYGQQYQRQIQKQQQQLQKQLNKSLPEVSSEEQTNNSVIVVKNFEDNQERCVSHRSSPTKTPVVTVEYKQRQTTANEDVNCQSKASLRSTPALPIIEEKIRPLTAPEPRPPTKEEKEKPPVDPNNDNSRHWLTYPNPKTPQYIIDVKQRLGQLRLPSTLLTRPSSASNASVQQKPPTPPTATRPSSASTQIERKQQTNNNDDQHNFLTFHTSATPDDLRLARQRLDKHRYNASLDNYPPRPKTCPVNTHENPKPVTPKQYENEQLPVQTPKNEAWIVDDEKASNAPDYESSSVIIQMVDCDGLPNEYYEALETANIAQEEYLRNFKKDAERRPQTAVYRLPTALPEHRNDSLVASQNQQQSTTMNNQLRQLARSSQNDFGVWVRNATDKERASAMKLLHDVLNQPMLGYDVQTRQKPASKQAPAPPPVRTRSATRKLGRTRTQHNFPCEICEKLLIKRHVWDLNESEIVTCPNHPRGIQVRA
ncbi:unnamed protein product [Rotaria magnacalcarata]|uniref:Uncharacterized protein n=4 Tax=Rotaria magnacalcarata TaxID=392030 RepID=A0A816WZC7_9BILA|nr:unnamed protein product [Rotaria magnacalcarata]CAF4119931.1 unnamed protein product [Rotaria magnacalcarata]